MSPRSKNVFTIPFRELILAVASRMRAIQAGSIHAYLAYIFVTLIVLLLLGVRS